MIPKSWSKEYKESMFEELAKDYVEEQATEEVKITPINDLTVKALARLDKVGLDGLSTGHDKLDKATDGFSNGELIVVSGATSHGKTQFVQTIILNMALNNIPTLFFSLEMPSVETTIRFMRMVKTKVKGDVIKDLPIYYFGGDQVNLQLLEEYIKQAVSQGIKFIVIDHLHFFCRMAEGQSVELGIITRTIKMLAIKYNIPICLLSHITKLYNTEKIPELDHLNGSSFISQDADTVIMVWRDMNSTDKEPEVIAKIRKNRRTGNLSTIVYRQDNNFYLEETDEQYSSKSY